MAIPDKQPTAPAGLAATPAPDLTVLLLTLVGQMGKITDRLEAIEKRTHEVEQGISRTVPIDREYAKEPWAEVIWVKAVRDCTYPDPDREDWYGIYRYGETEERPGDIFRLQHREHLRGNSAIVEINPAEVAALPVKKKTVPMTGARGVKQHVLPV